MKKILTLLLLFTLVGFLSGNQVIITNDYQYIVSTGKTYNFNNGNPSNNVKYDRTNKIQIQNNKVIANPLKYHYAFFWQEDNTFIGYYKTNKGITTSGAYLGQVNTQSIPLPLNAYSFALVRYDNDYVLVNGYTIEELFIDNNLAGLDPADFNDIPIAELNGLTLNELFVDSNLVLNNDFSNGTTNWEALGGVLTVVSGVSNIVGNGTSTLIRVRQPKTPSFPISTYYSRVQARITDNVALTLALTYLDTATRNVEVITSPIQNQFYNLSGVFTNIAPITFIQQINASYVDSATQNNKVLQTDNHYLLDLNALGISSLTKAQLDTYFNIYQNGVNATYYATDGNVSSVDGYYYASGKNLFDNTNRVDGQRFDQTTGNFIASGNQFYTPNYISIKPNTTYTYSFSASIDLRIIYYDENKTFISGLLISTVGTNDTRTTPSNAYYIRLSTAILKINTLQIEEGSTATTYEAFATPTTTLNLTFLFGVGNEPNKATMDGYYAEYEEYLEYLYVCCNIFATQTISFETIYFDDGVSTEIERLGSILIFTLIGFTLMIFGFVSRRRIFNLLSIGAFIVLGFLLVEFVGFIIILFGLVFINVYYTFFGEL